MSIPPTGWGAVESLIWDYAQELKKIGHEIQIVNNSNPNEIINLTNSFSPDFVHLQYDDYAYLMPYINCKKKAVTTHYAYTEQYENHPEYFNILNSLINGDFYIFCLSEKIKNTYLKLNIEDRRLYVTPNGARQDLFKFSERPLYPDRSLYLGKIDHRKRQFLYQDIKSLFFAGNYADNKFNINSKNYLGEWSKDFLYVNLTNYSNLILLSDGEADPLVTKEALIAGLGLVISEYATANLNLSLPFIDVIPNEKLDDLVYVENIIKENRLKSIENRLDIREYAEKNLSWNVIVDKYIKTIYNILNDSN